MTEPRPGRRLSRLAAGALLAAFLAGTGAAAGAAGPGVGASEAAAAPDVDGGGAPAPVLDVDVVVLDPGLPESAAGRQAPGVFPEIREAEARCLAVGVRNALRDSGLWGGVRVVPLADEAAELTLHGEILRSDGTSLAVALRAVDGTGRTWLQTSWHADWSGAADAAAGGAGRLADDPDAGVSLQPLCARIAADLAAVLAEQSPAQLARIRELALLRYAAGLAPEAFGDYLTRGEDGVFVAKRLPARDDPMLRRVRRVRVTDLQFRDTVDALYTRGCGEVTPAYALWRRYAARQTAYMENRQARLSSREERRSSRNGSYASLMQSYENYKWVKLQSQTLERLAARFDSEASPTLQSVEGRVIELTGSIEAQYAEWRELLRSIFALETGRPAGSAPPP